MFRNNAPVKMTPMLRQYLELKEQAGDALLLYRMGDFYELFFEDAQQAAPVLGIALTRRRHNDEVEAPMCGVPHHAFDGYLGKLLDAGFRVAVAEQVEDPAKAKGLVRREIIRTHTPGTVSATDLLDGGERCFLAAFGGDDDSLALAWLEVSHRDLRGDALRRTGASSPSSWPGCGRARSWWPRAGTGGRASGPRELPPPTVTPLPRRALLALRRRAAAAAGARGRFAARLRARLRRAPGRHGRRPARLRREHPAGRVSATCDASCAAQSGDALVLDRASLATSRSSALPTGRRRRQPGRRCSTTPARGWARAACATGWSGRASTSR